MRFGLDLGTTRTIAAAVDRGNYPIVTVEDSLGDTHDFIPSVVALKADRIVAGWDAIEVGQDHPSFVRSFKRLLSEPNVTEATPVYLGDHVHPLGAVLEAFAENVVTALRAFQTQLGDTSPIEVVIGVPANSHSAQRLLTMSAFSATGITVVGLVNEPSAAARVHPPPRPHLKLQAPSHRGLRLGRRNIRLLAHPHRRHPPRGCVLHWHFTPWWR